jgi:hypothetical protein
VTSNLDPQIQKADDGQGGGGIRKNRGAALNSFVVKILTSKPLGLKILQGIFVEPAPVKAFRELGGGGTHETRGLSQNETTRERPAEPESQRFFSTKIHSFTGKKSLDRAREIPVQRPNEKHIPPLSKGTQLRTENRELRTAFRL